jgi:hypothetical protein
MASLCVRRERLDGANVGRPVAQEPADGPTDRAAQFWTLASYWAKRGDLARAALARRNARLHGQTADLERETSEVQTRGNKNAAPPV